MRGESEGEGEGADARGEGKWGEVEGRAADLRPHALSRRVRARALRPNIQSAAAPVTVSRTPPIARTTRWASRQRKHMTVVRCATGWWLCEAEGEVRAVRSAVRCDSSAADHHECMWWGVGWGGGGVQRAGARTGEVAARLT
jgi:hypothetical protein